MLLFVSKDENLTKAHVRHLEARLLERAREANRCSFANRKDTIGGTLPEADLMDMEEFLAQVQLLAATLGLPAFEMPGAPGVGEEQKHGGASNAEVEFVYRGAGFDARAAVIGGDFVAYVFTQDYAFASPTGAAQVIAGSVVNGRAAWKLNDGRTYKEWQETQVEAAPIRS